MKRAFIPVIVLCLMLLTSCKEDDISRNLYEGVSLAGTEVHFPMGFLGDLQLMPKVSPDGQYLVYQNFYADGEINGLWVMDLNTSNKRLLVEGGYAPDWSPNGEWIAFNLEKQIYKIRLDGSELTQLTFEDEFIENFRTYRSESYHASWGRNEAIAVERAVSGHVDSSGVFLIDVHSAEKQRVYLAGQPCMSNDGKFIIGINRVADTPLWKRFSIYNLLLNKTEETLDVIQNENNQFPRFSKEDRRIVFQNRKGLYLLNGEDGHVQQLLPNDLYTTSDPDKIQRAICCASWYPDGAHIVYQRFEVNHAQYSGDGGMMVAGTMAFYKLNVDSALNNYR